MNRNNNVILFRCFEIHQPIGYFYVGAMNYKELIRITYSDTRTMIEGKKGDVEQYLGIERQLSDSRVKELLQYVNLIDATFPSSIILHITSQNATYEKSESILTITDDESVAKILDGQHRIAGLKGYKGEEAFEVPVTIFVDMDIEDQAMVFSTINLKQTKVSKSLAYDLYEYATKGSPQRTCHDIAKLLNTKEGSPFKNKIKILGRATGKPEESLTQATFVERLIGYISENPMQDRDRLKRGKKLEKVREPKTRQLIFRNMFIDEQDEKIARILWNFFSAVQKKWPLSWNEVRPGKILNKTTGFWALMTFLRPAYINLDNGKWRIVEEEEFMPLFRRITLSDDDFTPQKYLPGAKGEAALYKDLLKDSGLQET